MYRYLFMIALGMLACLSCSDSYTRVYTQWNLFITNNRPIAMDITAYHRPGTQKYRIDRTDIFDQVPLHLAPDSSATMALKLVFDEYGNTEPTIQSTSDFLFCLYIDSSHITTDSVLINKFPCSSEDECKYCNTYYDSSDIVFGRTAYFDTLKISSDSITSTLPTTFWKKIIR